MINHLNCDVLSGHLPPLIKVRLVNMLHLNKGVRIVSLWICDFWLAVNWCTSYMVIGIYVGVTQVGRRVDSSELVGCNEELCRVTLVAGLPEGGGMSFKAHGDHGCIRPMVIMAVLGSNAVYFESIFYLYLNYPLQCTLQPVLLSHCLTTDMF